MSGNVPEANKSTDTVVKGDETEDVVPSTSSVSETVVKPDEKPEDDGVTMVDVLQDEHELEEDAKAVLGAADDKNCTYYQGMPFQIPQKCAEFQCLFQGR